MRLDRDGRHDRTDLVAGRALDPLFAATVEATEEAVLNSLFAASTTVGRDGHRSESLHSPELLALLGLS
jgi:D-aminopeptidase